MALLVRMRAALRDGTRADIRFEDLGKCTLGGGYASRFQIGDSRPFTSLSMATSAAGRLEDDLRALEHEGVRLGTLEECLDGPWKPMPMPWACPRVGTWADIGLPNDYSETIDAGA